MIYLFYGTDVEKVRRQAFSFIEAARKKQPALAYVRLARGDLSRETLEDAVSAGSLFVSRLLVLIDDPFPPSRRSVEDDDNEEEKISSDGLIEESIDSLARSDNAIVLLAPKLSVARAKKIVPKAEKEYKFDTVATRDETRGFNSGLVNALGGHDGQKLWLEIARALIAGDALEQIHGLLHWKARNILEKGSRSWRTDEAHELSMNLISLLMTSRRTGADLSESLERFALSI
jgi:hypothetical protein